MLWGRFGDTTRIGLVLLDGDPDSACHTLSYTQCLRVFSLGIIITEDIFMHNTAPAHAARIIAQLLDHTKIQVMVFRIVSRIYAQLRRQRFANDTLS